MRTLHIIAFVFQVGLMILMAYEGFSVHSHDLLLGALGWLVAAYYSLERFLTCTE